MSTHSYDHYNHTIIIRMCILPLEQCFIGIFTLMVSSTRLNNLGFGGAFSFSLSSGIRSVPVEEKAEHSSC
jgi:hypothetical protein